MKKILLVSSFLFFVLLSSFAQSVITNERCYFLTDAFGLANLYELPLSEVQLGTIPKDKSLAILGFDTIHNRMVKVKYKNKEGWVYKNKLKNTIAIHYNLKLIGTSLNGIDQPFTGKDMYYEDTTMSVRWQKGEDRIYMALHNKSDKSIRIHWDGSSWVGVDWMAERITPLESQKADKAAGKTETVIPPHSRVTEMIVPVSQIYYDDCLGWKTKYLLRYQAKYEKDATDFNRSIADKTIKILLMVEQDDAQLEYNFTFKLSNPIIKKLQNDGKSWKQVGAVYTDDL